MSADELSSVVLADEQFNAPEYINSFLKRVSPGDELRNLQSLRKLLNAKSTTAAETIKDIVFEHYKHFIETSKEISSLEQEIYQLSTLLSEQKGLIEGLMEMSGQEKKSTSGSSAYSITTGSQNQFHTLMHKMDGVAAILNTLKDDERILLQGQLTLLNAVTMEPEHPILMVLLANALLIGYPINGGKYPFQLMANYPLNEIAIVNFKSRRRGAYNTFEDRASQSAKLEEPEQHVLQLLVFPEQIFVRCENARQKRDWFDTVEQMKRCGEQEKSLIRQATIRARRRSMLSLNTDKQKNDPRKQGSLIPAKIDENAEFSKDSALIVLAEENTKCSVDIQWLNDLYDELQVVISDRHMEQAVELLFDWKDSGCENASMNTKFTALERQVIKILSDDVRRPGALHVGGGFATTGDTPGGGGARGGAANQPLALLASLGRGIYAMDLYLRRRSAYLRASTAEIVSEEPLSYVKQISMLFVNEVLDVCNEFSAQRQHLCLVLQWASGELSVLLAMIRRNVVEVAPTITVLAHTWRILMNNCDQLTQIGMDLCVEVNRLLVPALRNALESNFNNVIESIVLRISEEKWKPYNLENESNLNRFLEEMSDFGLSIDWATCDENNASAFGAGAESSERNHTADYYESNSGESTRFAVRISQSACQFARLAFALSRDFALLNSARLERLTDSFLQMLWWEYLVHLSTAIESPVQNATAKFIVLQVIPLCDCTYQTSSAPDGRFASRILNAKFPALARLSKSASFDEEIANV